jgi:hypothetical protein
MNPQLVLPNWCWLNHANERSKRLQPFAPAGRPSNVPVSYTYPQDYGSKRNGIGWIGDASLAGKTDTQYGTVLDQQQLLYLFADRDIEILLRWMPGGWNETKLQGLLLTEFGLSAAQLPSLTWPNIIAMLASRNPVSKNNRSWRLLVQITDHAVMGGVIAALIVIVLGFAAWRYFGFSFSDFQFHTTTKP